MPVACLEELSCSWCNQIHNSSGKESAGEGEVILFLLSACVLPQITDSFRFHLTGTALYICQHLVLLPHRQYCTNKPDNKRTVFSSPDFGSG